ncbi:HSP20-like chaperone [Ascosphaera apis ARSEF 7405]|uniref:HSP20-like chaperone n=1 Tax=Ascosphaera apis ARSEF 7405 TaxID=392613 RepID=A0A167YFG9_9EURO|nr:HSP20-like chaperone [Ascosphaera apis ARSEF 7405]
MAFYNFSNAGRDFYNPDTGSPIIFFDDSDDDYVYAFIDDDDERQKPVKRRRQAEHKRNSSKRNQRTIARAPASDTESREQLPEKQYSIDLPDITGTWFAPRFDVRETQDNYYLHGELPGVEQEDVDIEFTDPRTIQVRGFVNRAYDDYNSPDNVDETSGSEEESDSIEDEFASVSADSSDAETWLCVANYIQQKQDGG